MIINRLNIIASRVFSITDQGTFASFSGDFNPIHMDVISARRSLTGNCTVHGINAFLWALDCLIMKESIKVKSVEVDFLKPIFLDERVSCVWDKTQKVMTLESDSVILTSCKLKMTEEQLKSDLGEIVGKKAEVRPKDLSFYEASLIKNHSFCLFGNTELCFSLFPNITQIFGSMVVCEIAAISQVVGMECPGLNSLFASLKIELSASEGTAHEFSVIKSNSRFNYLELSVIGRSIKASAGVFYRPPRIVSLSIDECSKYVKKGEFSDVRALIIGGSRGLGELVAKLIACGGGESVITYNVGKEEAMDVVNQILANEEKCAAVQYSIEAGNIDFSSLPSFNQVYYFATPKIASKRKSHKDEKLENKFIKYYVDEFYNLCLSLPPRNAVTSIFYPSTTLIDQPEKGLEEYITAKLKGEKICKELNDQDFQIIAERLPRMNTDQNISLFKLSMSNEIDVILPNIKAMTKSCVSSVGEKPNVSVENR